MTVAIAIVGILATLVAALGGAWYGARLQRSSDAETLALRLQIDAAANFLGAVAESTDAYYQMLKPTLFDLSLDERIDLDRIADAGLTSRAATVQIVGPQRLADVAEDLLQTAARIDSAIRFGRFEVAMSLADDFEGLAEDFEDEARNLFRPSSRQKNGRTPADSH